MLRIFSIIFILIVINISFIYSQDSLKSSEKNKIENTTKYPLFDLHVGVGIANGIRLGLRCQIIKSISLETSYGVSLNFLSGKVLYSAGVNFHINKFMFTFIYSKYKFVDRGFPYTNIYSINGGYINSFKFLRIFARGGLLYAVKYDYGGKDTGFGLNIDAGIGVIF